MKQFIEFLKNHVMTLLVTMTIALITIVTLFIINSNLTVRIMTLESLNEQQNRELSAKTETIDALTAEKEALIKKIAQTAAENDAQMATQKEAMAVLEKQLNNSFTVPDYVLTGLNTHGYADAKQFLETLSTQNDLIPIKGVLGGTMKWWPSYSVVLNEKYVFGYFEDGHILGYALLEYAFDQNNTLTWKIIDVFTD